jgi:hypothetical protein
MRRRRSTRALVLVLESALLLGASIAGCLSGQNVDLGTDVDPRGFDATAPVEAGQAPLDALSGDDSGVRDGQDDLEVSDEPPIAGSPVCILNPSFESTPEDDAGPGPMLANPPDWRACVTPGASTTSCTLPPTNGNSYLGLSIGLAPLLDNAASVDAELCQPLIAGVTYSVALELGLDAPVGDGGPTSGEPPALQLRGSTTACDPNAVLLLRFSGVSNTCRWKSLCGLFTPTQAYTHLVLIPETSSSTSFTFSQTSVLVDDITSGGYCPAL